MLLGRERDLEQVVAAFEGGARMVTILGPPGIGKTSLATAATAELEERFAATWFVDLTQARSEADLCLVVSSRLFGGSAVTTSPSVIADRLVEHQAALLVLDNFEQLSFAAGAVHAWSRASNELHVLVTSRERLAIDGERVVELMPLVSSDAAELFRTRARDAGAQSADDAEAIAEIVRRLDGIPLAIELAAARTRLFSPRELAARLERGFDVLSGAQKRGSARHQTLASAIAWSWDLLSADEQRALASCSVFAGSFTVGDAEAIVRAGVAGASSFDLIASLRDKSLVHVSDDGRLSLYVSIREFAAKKLAELGEEVAAPVRLAHATVFGELARRFVALHLLQDERADVALRGQGVRAKEQFVAALAFVKAGEQAGLRAQLAAAAVFLTALPAAEADRELTEISALSTLTPDERGVVALARQRALLMLGRRDEAMELGRAVLDLPGVSRSLRCYALSYAGIVLRSTGDIARAWEMHEAAAELLDEGPPLPRLAGMNTSCMGRLTCDRGDLAAARELNTLATEMCDRVGERWLAALGIVNLAQIEEESGSFERAEELFTQGLARFREAGEHDYEAIYSGFMGLLYFEWGKLELARVWMDKGVGLLGSAPSSMRAIVAGARASLEAATGDVGGAERFLDLACRAVRAPDPVVRVILACHTGSVEAARGGDAIARWRARAAELASGRGAEAAVVSFNIDARFALRTLERALGRAAAPEGKAVVLRVPREALWFSLADEGRVDLSRRGSLRRILRALCEEHAARRGAVLDVDALTAKGWPDERILAEAASTRVRVAIATLRKLGLRSVLMTRDDGYVLDPEATVEIVDGPGRALR